MTTIGTNEYLTKLERGNVFYQNETAIIFEFIACDISSSFNIIPLLESTPLTDNGFSDVSATAAIDICANILNNLFYFYTSDFSSNSSGFVDPLLYGINTDFKFDLSYSKAYIRKGTISGSGTQQISDDYIRYISRVIFGINNLVDIFSNETQLVEGVKAMDLSFNNIINDNINNISGTGKYMINTDLSNIYLDSSINSINNTYVKSCKQLLDGLINLNNARSQLFFSDLSNQQNNQTQEAIDASSSLFYIPFHLNDMISMKLTYNYNSSSQIPGYPTVGSRSYKIILKCVSYL